MNTTLVSSTAPLQLRATSAVRERAATIGAPLTRYALALTVMWIGAMKFTAYEAGAIQGLVANSPLVAWLYAVLSVEGAAALIGSSELTIGTLIALHPWAPRLSAIGCGLAAGLFLGTTSFLLSTPGVAEASLGGFPALSVVPGQFLLKDLVLLGASVWLATDGWSASEPEK